jgi:hypothetical protein
VYASTALCAAGDTVGVGTLGGVAELVNDVEGAEELDVDDECGAEVGADDLADIVGDGEKDWVCAPLPLHATRPRQPAMTTTAKASRQFIDGPLSAWASTFKPSDRMSSTRHSGRGGACSVSVPGARQFVPAPLCSTVALRLPFAAATREPWQFAGANRRQVRPALREMSNIGE